MAISARPAMTGCSSLVRCSAPSPHRSPSSRRITSPRAARTPASTAPPLPMFRWSTSTWSAPASTATWGVWSVHPSDTTMTSPICGHARGARTTPEDAAGRGLDHGYRVAEAVAGPQLPAIRRHLHHIWAAADRPRRGHLARCDVNDGDGTGEAVAHVQPAGVPVEGQSVRAETCGDEGDLLHPLRVEDANAVATLIRDKEHRTVGGQAHVDRQAADVRVADDHPSREIDF